MIYVLATYIFIIALFPVASHKLGPHCLNSSTPILVNVAVVASHKSPLPWSEY
jgi:hypothetical protein